MPRFELDPVPESVRALGNTTVDLCLACARRLVGWARAGLLLETITSEDVAHPPYSGDRYTCHACQRVLTYDDDWSEGLPSGLASS